MRYLAGLVLVLALGLMACSETAGTGGSGGSGGEGGAGGAPETDCGGPCGTGFTCQAGECLFTCVESPPEPPTLADVCAALEGGPSRANPDACDTFEISSVTHELTLLATERNVSIGFDLDESDTLALDDGNSCTQGALTTGDGGTCIGNPARICTADWFCEGEDSCNQSGVDNQLGWMEPVFESLAGSPSGLGTALSDAICDDPRGPMSLEIGLAVNAEDDCANVTLRQRQQFPPAGPMPLNFVDGCLSGTLGTIPLTFPRSDGSVTVQLDNASIAVSVDQAAGFRGILAATVGGDDAAALAEIIQPGGGPIVGQTFDILQSLEVAPETDCDSFSMTLRIGGVK